MKKQVIVVFVLLMGCIGSCLWAVTPKGAAQKADLVLQHGKIYTVDAPRSWASAVAVSSGRIVYVGDDSGAAAWIGPKTQKIDLAGRLVLPGFIDAHVHPISSGVEMNRCDVSEKTTKEGVLAAIKQCAQEHPEKPWVIGNGWALPLFPNANPQKEWLDEIVPDRPVMIGSADGHSVWVNSKALQAAGITKNTPDPQDGRIEHNAQGEPSGALRESASDLVYNVAPKATLEEEVQGLKQAIALMNSTGITGVNDASVGEKELKVYQETEKRGLLTLRVAASMYADPEGVSENLSGVMGTGKKDNPSGDLQQRLNAQVEKFKKLRTQYQSKHLKTDTVKIFEDGVIETGTAALLQPYLGKGNDAGSVNWEPAELNPFVATLDKENFQVHFHAIGDRAIRYALDAAAYAQKQNGIRDARTLIAHLQLIDPQDVPRFAQLRVIPVFQPLWAFADTYITDLTVPVLGSERMRWNYPMGSVAKYGAMMAMGSDWSVSSVNPLDGIEVSVTRRDPEESEPKGEPFVPDERLDLRTAVDAYTIGSSYANFWEKETGSIEAGKSADLIVLSDNIFEVPPSRINDAKVMLTLFEGKKIYESK
jgi:hypothetical protein